MRKLLTAGVLAGGSLLAVPVVVAAQDDNGGWFADTLTELVSDGTLTEEQAAAVQEALAEARPDAGPGRWQHDPGEQRSENLAERITELVNESFPRHRHDHEPRSRAGD